MKIQNDGISGKTVQQSGSKGKVSSAGRSSAESTSENGDTVNLTATGRVEQLMSQIENLPVVNTAQVSEIRQQIGTGSYVADEENAADQIIETEKGFSKQK